MIIILSTYRAMESEICNHSFYGILEWLLLYLTIADKMIIILTTHRTLQILQHAQIIVFLSTTTSLLEMDF